MRTHEQVRLERSACEVDEGIAVLIEWFHASQVETLASCQGGPYDGWWEGENKWFAPGVAQSYVQFASLSDTERAFTLLVDLADKHERPDLIRRIAARPWLWRATNTASDWDWIVMPLAETNGAWPECGRIVVVGTVHFDVSDLELVSNLITTR